MPKLSTNGGLGAFKGMFGEASAIMERDGAIGRVLANAGSRAMKGAMVGAAAGAGLSLIDQDPSTGLIGGALKGGLIGAGIGAAGGALNQFGNEAYASGLLGEAEIAGGVGERLGWSGLQMNPKNGKYGRTTMDKLFGSRDKLAQGQGYAPWSDAKGQLAGDDSLTGTRLI